MIYYYARIAVARKTSTAQLDRKVFFFLFVWLFFCLLKTARPMANRGSPNSSGGEIAAAQPTRGVGVSNADTRQMGLGRKEE